MRKEWKVFCEEEKDLFNHDFDLNRCNDGTLTLSRSNSGNWCDPRGKVARLYDSGNGITYKSGELDVKLTYCQAQELLIMLKKKKRALGKIKYYE